LGCGKDGLGGPQGLKAESSFGVCGTSEVVPFPVGLCEGFSAASEVVPLPGSKACGGGPQKPET
jgi:hypothetical protein